MSERAIDRLNQLAQGNFLGGLVQEASAKLMTKRLKATDETLTDLNETLAEVEGGEPLTQPEQIQRLKESPEGKEIIGKVEDQANRYMEFQNKIQQRREKYNEAYMDAQRKLALIGGKEAGRASQVLGLEQQMTAQELERKEKASQMELEFQNALLDNETRKLEYRNTYDTLIQNENVQVLTDMIRETAAFKAMPMGKQSFSSRQDYLEANKNMKALETQILSEIKGDPDFDSYFGDEKAVRGMFTQALEGLKQVNGVGLSYKQPIKRTGGGGAGSGLSSYYTKYFFRETEKQKDLYADKLRRLEVLTEEYLNDENYPGVREFIDKVISSRTFATEAGLEEDDWENLTTQGGRIKNLSRIRQAYLSNNPSSVMDPADVWKTFMEKFGAGGKYRELYAEYTGLYRELENEKLKLPDQAGQLSTQKVPIDLHLPSSEDFEETIKNRKDKLGTEVITDMVDQYTQWRNTAKQRFRGFPRHSTILHVNSPIALLRGTIEGGVDWSPQWARDLGVTLRQDPEDARKSILQALEFEYEYPEADDFIDYMETTPKVRGLIPGMQPGFTL